MDFNAIIKRVTAILTKPKEEWDVIKNEQLTVSDMFLKYAIILAAIPAVAGLLGFSIIGISVGPYTVKVPISRSLIWAVVTYAGALGAVYIFGMVIDILAPNFGAQKEMNRSLKLTVFSATPGWIAGVLFLIPSIGIIATLAGLYGLYILYVGIGNLKECPKDKEMNYFIFALVVQIILSFIIYFIAREIAMPGIGL